MRWDPAPFGGAGFEGLGIDAADFWVGCAAILCLFITDLLRKKRGPLTPLLLTKPLAVQWAVLLAGIAAVVVFGMYGAGYKVLGAPIPGLFDGPKTGRGVPDTP